MADSQRKTANLCDESTIQQGYYGTQAINYSVITADNKYRSFTKNLKAGTYTLNINADETMYILRCNNDIDGSINVYSNPPYIFTLSADTTIYVSWRNTNTTNSFTNMTVMLNEGSTALPYEPYGWQHSLRKLGTSTDTITTLPADVYADGTNATVGLVGNMEQTGTPTPQTPIQPQECGERTGNLYNDATTEQGYRIQWTTGNAYADATALMSDYIPVPTGDYRISSPAVIVGYDSTKAYMGVYRADLLTWEKRMAGEITAFNVASDAGISYIKLLTYGEATPISSITMLNAGQTALPYEPYGYKIPISSANTTTPVYLGEVESTRRIKKYVFTGEETFSRTISSTESGTSVYSIRYDAIGMEDIIDYDSPMPYISYPVFICSHFKMKTNTSFDTPYTAIKNGEIGANSVANNTYNRYVIFASNQYTSDVTFKAFLADQYTNGTPVTVWYILAAPTTGIVNEPLRKIGTYADTVSGITIPTITGKDTFDVLTSLKPSEVSLAYTGWHDASAKEWDGSEWQ